MIKVIPGEWRDRYPRRIDEMHKLRRNVFHERLQWRVSVINRWEIDGYDALNPLYVIAMDDEERVIGGLRLLPTTGFNMLNDTFPELLPDGERFSSPLIWESSRFTVKMTGDIKTDAAVIGRATAELGLALNEIAKVAALSHVVTVYDRTMHRLLTRADWAGEPLGPPKNIGGVETYAVLYEIGKDLDERVHRLAERVGVHVDAAVFEPVRLRIAS